MLTYLGVKRHDVHNSFSKFSEKRTHTHTSHKQQVAKLMNMGEECKKFFTLFL